MREISEKEVEMLAKILGGFSAAATALKNAEHRRAAGEVVRFFQAKGSIVVQGVRPEDIGGAQGGCERGGNAG